jgi:F0F1-type ATP synthase assembly protein I
MRNRFTYYTLKVIECIMLAMFFGFVPVLFCLLATVIIASALFGTKGLGPWVLWSFVPAIAIDSVLMKKWIRCAYLMSNVTLGILYLFYSVVTLGMCMGIPIGSFILGIAAGLYAARRMQIAIANEKKSKRYFKKTAIFSASVMALMCCLITLWAIAGQMIGYRIETFTITAPIFLIIVLVGGAIAVILQYLVTFYTAKLTSKLLSTIFMEENFVQNV